MKTIVRMTKAVYEAIKDDIKCNSPNETMLFALSKSFRTEDREIHIVPEVILLDESDAIRSPFSVQPTEAFQHWFYGKIKKENYFDRGYSAITLHSHPFQNQKAAFSSIDWNTMRADKEIYEKAYDGHDFLWIVFSKDAGSFDGCVVGRNGNTKIDQIIVYGDTLKVINNSDCLQNDEKFDRELYSRMLLIPEWDQKRIYSS